MRCTSISYGRKVSLPDYQNFHLEMTAELAPEDDTDEALEKLTQAVDDKCAAIKAKFQTKKP